MILPKITLFKQRQPREFNYKPIYFKEKEEEHTESYEDRIRKAYGKDAGVPQKSFKEAMEERRYLATLYNNGRTKSRVVYLIAFLAILVIIYFML